MPLLSLLFFKSKVMVGIPAVQIVQLKGKYSHRKVCFPGEGRPRPDNDFLNQVDEAYHLVVSILTEIPNFGLVSNVPLDYIHVVCLGVMHKLIFLWLDGPLPVRLQSSKVNLLSKNLTDLRKTTPCEFARKPRSIDDITNWKATEFRSFLLYLGPVVLRKVLATDIYNNFLTLHVAIVILACERLNKFLNYAKDLLKHFVSDFSKLYGERYPIIFSAHCICPKMWRSMDRLILLVHSGSKTSCKQ